MLAPSRASVSLVPCCCVLRAASCELRGWRLSALCFAHSATQRSLWSSAACAAAQRVAARRRASQRVAACRSAADEDEQEEIQHFQHGATCTYPISARRARRRHTSATSSVAHISRKRNPCELLAVTRGARPLSRGRFPRAAGCRACDDASRPDKPSSSPQSVEISLSWLLGRVLYSMRLPQLVHATFSGRRSRSTTLPSQCPHR